MLWKKRTGNPLYDNDRQHHAMMNGFMWVFLAIFIFVLAISCLIFAPPIVYFLQQIK